MSDAVVTGRRLGRRRRRFVALVLAGAMAAAAMAGSAAAYWVSYPPACGWQSSATWVDTPSGPIYAWTSVYACHDGGRFWAV